MLFDEANRMFRDERGVVTFFVESFFVMPPVSSPVSIDPGEVISGSVQVTDKLVKSVPSRAVGRFVAEVPFAHQSRRVASATQSLGNRDDILRQPFRAFAQRPFVDSTALLILARQDGRPRW